MERAWIISVGTELALGQTVDTNAAWLARRLAAIGIRAERHVTVDDALESLRDLAREAADAADVVIVTGGLGPTEDDRTRQALAAAAGVELQLHPASLEQMRAFFVARDREMPDRNRVQALVPLGGQAIPNSCGTAPGFSISVNGTPLFALPGVPHEMEVMFDSSVRRRLLTASAGRVLIGRVIHVIGPGESDLGERIRDLMAPGRNPQVGTTARLGVISIRINAEADTRSAAQAMLDETEREIKMRFGTRVIGRDGQTLPVVVGEYLAACAGTVCTAESCTGGLVGKQLTDVAGSSRYYLGSAVTYSNDAKIRMLGVSRDLLAAEGAVSESVARAMAIGVRRSFDADYGISVTGIAGPGGGSPDKPVGLVYFGLATPAGVACRKVLFGGDAPRAVVRARAAHTALDLLRRELLR